MKTFVDVIKALAKLAGKAAGPEQQAQWASMIAGWSTFHFADADFKHLVLDNFERKLSYFTAWIIMAFTTFCFSIYPFVKKDSQKRK